MNSNSAEKAYQVSTEHLRSMLLIAFQALLFGPILVFVGDRTPYVEFLGTSLYVMAVASTLVGVYLVTRAIIWSRTTIAVEETVLRRRSAWGSQAVSWGEVTQIRFTDAFQMLHVRTEGGEGFGVYAGVEKFDELLAELISRLASNRAESNSRNTFTHIDSHRKLAYLVLAVWMVAILGTVFVDQNMKMALILGGLFLIVAVTQAMWGKWDVVVDDDKLSVTASRGGRDISMSDIEDVAITIKATQQSKLKNIVLRIVIRNAEPYDINFRGPDLLPLYLRLKELVGAKN